MTTPAQLADVLDTTERRMLHMIGDGNLKTRGSKCCREARKRLTCMGLLGMSDSRDRVLTPLGIEVRAALLASEGRR